MLCKETEQFSLSADQDINVEVSALDELKQHKQWVNWIQGTKQPVRPNGLPAKSTDPLTWSSYDDVVKAATASPKTPGTIGGIGFVLDGYTGVDFDHAIVDGQTEQWASAEIKKLDTYTEISPSGTGYHCISRAKLPGTGRKAGRTEIYDSGRYFTFTGNHVPGTPSIINDNQAAVSSFYKRIGTIDPDKAKTTDPFVEFRNALKGRTVESLLADDSISIICTDHRHVFINKVIGLLWDGTRTSEELCSIARTVEERFCSGTRVITDKEIDDMVQYVMDRTPHQNSTASESPSQKYKNDLLAAEWFQPVEDFIVEPIPSKKVFISDKSGNPVFTSASINQIFAFRGYGKSLFMLGVLDLMIHGGEMLGYKSDGGLKVLLCDGELPPQDLQKRLKQFVGDSHEQMKLMSTHNLPNHMFPALSDLDFQSEFLNRITKDQPDVIVFDTLTACFKFDTNDTDEWLVINQFLVELRQRGICVIITHHAGKNGTQRGRTDGDDNLDLVIKLDAPSGHTAGMGLHFVLSYEKVRADSRLSGFEVVYDDGAWEIVTTGDFESTVAALNDGKSYKWFETQLGISSKKIAAYKKKAEALGLLGSKGLKEAK